MLQQLQHGGSSTSSNNGSEDLIPAAGPDHWSLCMTISRSCSVTLTLCGECRVSCWHRTQVPVETVRPQCSWSLFWPFWQKHCASHCPLQSGADTGSAAARAWDLARTLSLQHVWLHHLEVNEKSYGTIISPIFIVSGFCLFITHVVTFAPKQFISVSAS